MLLAHDLQNLFAVLRPVRLQVAKEGLGEAQGRRAIRTAWRASRVAAVPVSNGDNVAAAVPSHGGAFPFTCYA